MIIGISAKMGCGKTTLAKELQHALATGHKPGEGVPVLRAFADPLKAECSEHYKYPLEWNYSDEGKARTVAGDSVRRLLQVWGTEVRRAQDKDYWIKAFDRYVERDILAGDHIIVHDVRFPNEAAWVKEKGGLLVRLDPFPGWRPGPHAQHASETALDQGCAFDMSYTPGYGELRRVALDIYVHILRGF